MENHSFLNLQVDTIFIFIRILKFIFHFAMILFQFVYSIDIIHFISSASRLFPWWLHYFSNISNKIFYFFIIFSKLIHSVTVGATQLLLRLVFFLLLPWSSQFWIESPLLAIFLPLTSKWWLLLYFLNRGWFNIIIKSLLV
jgi:hypothetical protein